MNFSYAPEFKKELKTLSKKWRSLSADIEYVKPRIEALYIGDNQQELTDFRNAFFNGKRATILQKVDDVEVVKIRLDVESLGSNNKVRVVFIAVIATGSVTFLEIYAKNEKDNVDTARIKRYLS